MLVITEETPTSPTVVGYDWNTGRDLDGLMESMMRTGFQATCLGQAIHEVNRMVRLTGQGASAAGHWG